MRAASWGLLLLAAVAAGQTRYRSPDDLALSPDGKRFYVTNSWSDTVSEVDAASLQVLRTLPAGFEPTGVAMDAARNVLYVANRLSDDISIVAWDDSLMCGLVHPPLTAVTRDIPAYGAAATKLLLATIDGHSPGDIVTPRGVLTPRGSTGSARAAQRESAPTN